jgi:AraC family transcriptional regulator of adaptative response/methylated-DNA-[protein]-cysteine methyltransferase
MNNLSERCEAFETVARTIRYLRANARAQPTLDEIAAQAGLSAFHLQRLFGAWAGISPKRFLQFLTREHARGLLRQSADVLTVALDAGLSGPGRLHDLMIACDAATPGEIRALGAGLVIRYGYAPTPFGRVIAGVTTRGLCHLQFVEGDDDAALAGLEEDWPHATLVRDDEHASATIVPAFAVGGCEAPLHLLLRGTNFQIKVWQALLEVGSGEVVSYQTVARMTGNPRAQRAVGSAIAKNRIAILIPCHRVIRESGDIGEYRWGSERKSALLAYEAAVRSRPHASR